MGRLALALLELAALWGVKKDRGPARTLCDQTQGMLRKQPYIHLAFSFLRFLREAALKLKEGVRTEQTQEKANKKGREAAVMWIRLNASFSLVTL